METALEEADTTSLVRPNQLDVAPFGMDFDVHSNRSSIVATVRSPSFILTPLLIPLILITTSDLL